MIEVKNLTKVYGDRVAVDNISFSVNKGEILGFLGQNGAGKTTTMKILTCFMPASEGTASIAGFDVFDNPLEVKRRIGYLPEAPPVYKELLVSEYLDFVAELRGVPRAERSKKIDVAVEKTSLGDVRDRLIGNLSKGYRQRVGIAQALIHDPEVLILDEPTVGLDPKQVNEARGLIRSLRTSHTVIYSTHILSEVQASCDRIVIIDRGKIVAQESLNEMGSTGKTTKTELVVQKMSEKMIDAIRKLKGVKEVHATSNGSNRLIVESEPRSELMAEISKTVVDQNAGLVRMSPVQLALEEYYLNLIGGEGFTMNGTMAIIKKEVKTYFYSPVAYVLLGIFLFIMGIIFAKFVSIYVSVNQQQRFGGAQGITLDKLATYLYQNMAFILCFVTPFLTMKLFAEEKSQNTLELLLTAPLRTSDLVIGKFLGAYALMSIMVVLSFVYAFFMIIWGNPEVIVIASTYLGLLLALACYVSLGALISALASSQAIAAVWTFIVLLLLWLLQSLGQGITASWGPIQLGPTLIYLSPLGHFNSFNEGLIQLKDVVYFITFIGFMLFLTHRVVESNRWR